MSEEKLEIPKLLEDRIDLRALTVNTFIQAIELLTSGKLDSISVDNNTKVVIYTTIGTITGQLFEEFKENSTEQHYSIIHEQIMKSRNFKLEQFEKEDVNRIINDSGYIALSNVTISPYGNPAEHKMPYFLLFPEQIVGITFGTKE